MKEQVARFLEEVQKPSKTKGLDKMKSLMKRLGNPQDNLKIIHVAGTNGKGSVCAMLTSVLMEAGYNVGLFTSPHLVEYNERIQINRLPIPQDDFEKIGSRVQKACNQMMQDGEEPPIFFEVITAMAFIYFYKQDVDIVILETGIGGRYDATNIIKTPLASVITSIGKDHMEFLGDTIEEISREKSGIIKENCPTVLYDSDKSVYNIISAICTEKNSQLFSAKDSIIVKEGYTMEGTNFSIKNKSFAYDNISLELLGKYQVSNAKTTLFVIESLKKSGYNISREHIYTGLQKANWAGRMELIQKNPPIIIDGAHNEESAKAFIESLQGIIKENKVYMLIGVVKGKDYKTILKILMPYTHTVIVTESSYSRALPAKNLYDEIKKMEDTPKLILEDNLLKAYNKAKKMIQEESANKQGNILCCLGSLYLVGELKQFLNNQEVKNVEL